MSERAGALLATSAVSRGLFHDDPFNLDVSGGFATPVAAELIKDADLLIGWGCALSMWTPRHGTLIGDDTTVIQVDVDPDALGAHHRIDLGITGDAAATARAVPEELDRRAGGPPPPGEWPRGYRTAEIAERLAREGRWRDVPYKRRENKAVSTRARSPSPSTTCCPRSARSLSTRATSWATRPCSSTSPMRTASSSPRRSSPSAWAWPPRSAPPSPARTGSPSPRSATAAPLMGASELETAVRLGLDLLIVVYDDEAYGAEVHHFGPHGDSLDNVRFPPADIAAIARGYGYAAATVRARRTWPRSGPGWPARATARCSSTPRSPGASPPGG